MVAVLLLAAGGAKLADLPGFAASVRLFVPRIWGPRLPRWAALAIALGEIALGGASLTTPLAGWLNVVVAGLCCGFVAVAVTGYLRHPGQPCRCFGALSRRAFGPAGIGRAALIALAAAAAVAPVRLSLVQVGTAGRLGLMSGGAMVAGCAYTAAAALAGHRDAERGRA